MVKRIKISRNKGIKTLLFADDQVTVANSEAAVNISVRKLQTINSKCGLKFPRSKTKAMAFKETELMRSKTVINGDIIEEINTFSYQSCYIS